MGVTYNIAHQLNSKLTLAPSVSWIRTSALAGTGPLETADIFQVGMTLTRTFTRHLNGSIQYYYQTRDSNLANSSYDVNDIMLTLNYTF